MKFAFHSKVMLVRFFRRRKTAFAVPNSASHDLNAPFSLVRAHTKKPNLIGFSSLSHILKILRPRNFTQIAKTIIAFIAIYVVNVLRWPTPRNVRPSKSVRQLFFVAYSNRPIACGVLRPGYCTYKIRPPTMRFPFKNTLICIVIKNATKMRYGTWFFGCHDNQVIMETA
jgi:hypothetical protein